ncbi:hypothetical protein E2986_11508 [Frieseomelitta varia]|uniref:Uncharacterized protein n=1 Tax=Frieseomelitta varia TaxID=561572 RepID=A0A833SJW1_9HYME|nr:hypothetical protein E2986_11508 [Frieseomelitta varia]
MLQRTWQEIEYRLDLLRATNGPHIERLYGHPIERSISIKVSVSEKSDSYPNTNVFAITECTISQKSIFPTLSKRILLKHGIFISIKKYMSYRRNNTVFLKI